MDKLTPEQRSENMRRITSKGTKPEMVVRRLAHKLGYRFRLHKSKLPGNPDMVFSSRRKVIFVHGCFWHQHADKSCKIAHRPKSNLDYWQPKLQRNVRRHSVNEKELKERGWDVLTVWECMTKPAKIEELADTLEKFLDAREHESKLTFTPKEADLKQHE